MPEDTNNLPSPQSLQTQSKPEGGADGDAAVAALKQNLKPRRNVYRPSHKGTFIALAVVAVILIANAGIIWFVLKSQTPQDKQLSKSEVTLSSETLNKLGVSKNTVSDQGTELIVGPASKFANKVTMGSDVTIAGQLMLNNAFNASDANVGKLKTGNLQAGDTAVNQLNVNGDGSVTTLNARKDVNVAGATKLQGPVTIGQLLTVNNSVNILGNLSVGGLLAVRNFQASSLTSDTTLTIGGHILTRGSAPAVSTGPAVGSNGTVSISGNDAAGTVAFNAGVGAGGGIVANVTFKNQYSSIPHVVVTGVGGGMGAVYITRSASGFSIGIEGRPGPGGYAFDYVVVQ